MPGFNWEYFTSNLTYSEEWTDGGYQLVNENGQNLISDRFVLLFWLRTATFSVAHVWNISAVEVIKLDYITAIADLLGITVTVLDYCWG